MAEEDASLIVRAAAARRGLITADEIDALGVSRHRRRRLVEKAVIEQIVPGIFLLAGTPINWNLRLHIALLQVAPGGAAGFETAASIWGLPRFGDGPVEVVVDRSEVPPHRPIGKVHRTRRRLTGEVTTRGGVRVTDPIRTVSDLASRIPGARLDECIQDLARRGLLTMDRLVERFERWRGSGHDGVRALEAAIERNRGRPSGDSFLETSFLGLIRRHGFPTPEVQAEIETRLGLFRVDCLFREASLVVELKGYGTHATRSELNADAAREAAIASVGLRVVSFTYDQVMSTPAAVVDALSRLFRVGQVRQAG